MTDTPRWAWMDGEFVPWGAAKVHVRTECVMRGANVFEGITRATLLRPVRDELGAAVEEHDVERAELYHADEIFLCGTHTEVLPVLSVDRYPVGSGAVGRITEALQNLFFATERGPACSRFLTAERLRSWSRSPGRPESLHAAELEEILAR